MARWGWASPVVTASTNLHLRLSVVSQDILYRIQIAPTPTEFAITVMEATAGEEFQGPLC